ncbi:hypothetical protein ACJZ2D_017120 [Fusarium nematophilum]
MRQGLGAQRRELCERAELRVYIHGHVCGSAPVVKEWRIVTGGSSNTFEKLRKTSEGGDLEQNGNRDSEAHMAMEIRRDLGELADWRGPASAEAVTLARAIEVTMDALFGNSLTGEFTWSLGAHYLQPGVQSVNFRLERDDKGWKAYADEIEAALSLWLYSVGELERDKHEQEQNQHQQEQNQHQQEREQHKSPGTRPRKDDGWLRAKGLPAKHSLRLLGPSTPALCRDLQWWIPRDVAGIMGAEKDKDGMLEVANHRVVGCGSGPEIASQYPSDQTQKYKSRELEKLSFDQAGKLVDGEGTGYDLLATESYDRLKLVYAQDMFSSFMWAAAKTLTTPVEGGADIRPNNTSGDNAWQSFTLRNALLSKMAQDIQSTGLGSLDQIYLSIIPSLSVEQKLPQADEIVKLARQHAKRHEQLQHWQEAGDAYLWLFRTAKTFQDQIDIATRATAKTPPELSRIATRATAVLMEYLRTLTLAIEMREAQQYDERDVQGLKELKSSLEKELKSSLEKELKAADPGILSSLMRLYKEQNRSWNCDLVQETESAGEEDATYLEKFFNFTKLHQVAQPGGRWRLEEHVGNGKDANPKDIHDWTPLHYAAARGSADVTKKLLQGRADANARDLLEWTPLHYACQHGAISIVQELLREGAELDVRGRDGVAPLHCAAMNGHLEVVRSLIEAGAAADVLDASGNTPLLWAAYKGCEDVVQYLWQDVNKKLRDHNGRAALHLAATAGGVEVVKWLVKPGTDKDAGADKDAKDRFGRTPLHWAAGKGHEAVVRLLRVHIAQPSSTTLP